MNTPEKSKVSKEEIILSYTNKVNEGYYDYKGDGPTPPYWYAPDGTKVYRDYEAYCMD